MRILRTSRYTGVLALALVVAVGVAGIAVYTRVAPRGAQSLCAVLADSAGLYEGNPVNIRGVRVGEVAAVTPEHGHVVVRMTVEDRPLDPGMRVVAVNNSGLADRRIELIDAVPSRGDGARTTSDCVPLNRTATPISLSAAFESFTDVFDDLAGSGEDSAKPIGELVKQLNTQFADSGSQINAVIGHVASFLAEPAQFLADIRTTVRNLAALSEFADGRWRDLSAIMGQAAQLTDWMRFMFAQFVRVFDNLGEAGRGLDDLLTRVLPRALDVVDENRSAVDAGLAQIDDLAAIMQHVPALTAGIAAAANTSGPGAAVNVRGPRVRVRTPDAAALCRLAGSASGSAAGAALGGAGPRPAPGPG